MVEWKIINPLNEKKAFQSREIGFQSRLIISDFGLAKKDGKSSFTLT